MNSEKKRFSSTAPCVFSGLPITGLGTVINPGDSLVDKTDKGACGAHLACLLEGRSKAIKA